MIRKLLGARQSGWFIFLTSIANCLAFWHDLSMLIMPARGSFHARLLGDLIASLLIVMLQLVHERFNARDEWRIPIVCIIPVASIVAGYQEPSARRVWIHPFFITLAQLTYMVIYASMCDYTNCFSLVDQLELWAPVMSVLIGLSYAAFFIRRLKMRAKGS